MSVLVIAPHCDDAELGCGGYLASAQALEDPRGILVLGVSTYLAGDKLVLKQTRVDEQRAAAKILGVQVHIGTAGGQENAYAQAVPDMVRLIERTVDRLKPDVLFVPLPSFNQDHKAAWA
jgi:N-acetylglucosamine malate deacetylase 1